MTASRNGSFATASASSYHIRDQGVYWPLEEAYEGRSAELGMEGLLGVGVGDEEVGEDGEASGRRLVAGYQEEGQLGQHLLSELSTQKCPFGKRRRQTSLWMARGMPLRISRSSLANGGAGVGPPFASLDSKRSRRVPVL